MEMEFETYDLINDAGYSYGTHFVITQGKGSIIDLQTLLIEEVIGVEYYYSPRDIWNQIEISDGRGE